MNRSLLLSALLLAALACGGPEPVEMPAPPPEPFVPTAKLQQVAAAQAAAAAEVEPAQAAPALIATAEQASAAIDQLVRVVGEAQDAKLSAVVAKGELLVYCMERGEDGVLAETRWPEGTVGQQVAVTGTLVSSDQFVATVGDEGEISQGTEGSILAVVAYETELIPALEPGAP